jgi:hypothetical protein
MYWRALISPVRVAHWLHKASGVVARAGMAHATPHR